MATGTSVTNLAAGVRAFTSNAFLVTGDDRVTDDVSATDKVTDDAGVDDRTVLVDVGANFDVVTAVRERADDVDAVLLTHTHPDHVGNVDAVREAFDVETWGFDPAHPAVDNRIADRETVRIGNADSVALHTPGHKDDHLCFYSHASGVLLAGDLVFQNGAFGRTDLPEGDRETLVGSVDRVLETIGEGLRELHVGHGPSVTERPYDHVELAARAARS